MIVAIDGPAGSGKSTVARMLAERLGFCHLETGAMYRSVALLAENGKCDLTDQSMMANLAKEARIEFVAGEKHQRVLLNGSDVTDRIRSEEIGRKASQIAAYPELRKNLVAKQRDLSQGSDVILDGRDIGTVVFPSAEKKFFLVADAEKRASRRFDERRQAEPALNYEDVLEQVIERDRSDRLRKESPLMQAEDAVLIDTTDLTPVEVIDLMLGEIKK